MCTYSKKFKAHDKIPIIYATDFVQKCMFLLGKVMIIDLLHQSQLPTPKSGADPGFFMGVAEIKKWGQFVGHFLQGSTSARLSITCTTFF